MNDTTSVTCFFIVNHFWPLTQCQKNWPHHQGDSSWHLLKAMFFFGIAPSNTPVVMKSALQLQRPSDSWHLNFMKITRSKVNGSIVLKIYCRNDKIILTYQHLLNLLKAVFENDSKSEFDPLNINDSTDVSNTWRTGRWIRARWSCAGVPPHQRIKSCWGLMKILKIAGPS